MAGTCFFRGGRGPAVVGAGCGVDMMGDLKDGVDGERMRRNPSANASASLQKALKTQQATVKAPAGKSLRKDIARGGRLPISSTCRWGLSAAHQHGAVQPCIGGRSIREVGSSERRRESSGHSQAILAAAAGCSCGMQACIRLVVESRSAGAVVGVSGRSGRREHAGPLHRGRAGCPAEARRAGWPARSRKASVAPASNNAASRVSTGRPTGWRSAADGTG